MTEVLTLDQLRKLKHHKYSVQGSTVLDPIFQVYWRWLVEQVPLWWAPNAMTLAGLLCNIVSGLVLVYYSPQARTDAPRWAYALCALGLFTYQSLDAIDGKQARRTGSSSPLGELFDHGCDALSTCFVMVCFAVTLKLGDYPNLMFLMCFAAVFMFYFAHWQTYVSGTLLFNNFDVTEAQVTVMTMELLTAFLGPDIWLVTVLGVELRCVPCGLFMLGAALCLYMQFPIILGGGAGRNGATIADTSVIFPIFPIAWVIILALMTYQNSLEDVYQREPCLFILTFGLVSAKITIRLVICHMTRSAMELVDFILIGPLILAAIQFFNATFISERYALYGIMFFSTQDLLRYSASACRQICDYLNIECFRVSAYDSHTHDQTAQRFSSHNIPSPSSGNFHQRQRNLSGQSTTSNSSGRP